jgi:hypothetical protein
MFSAYLAARKKTLSIIMTGVSRQMHQKSCRCLLQLLDSGEGLQGCISVEHAMLLMFYDYARLRTLLFSFPPGLVVIFAQCKFRFHK